MASLLWKPRVRLSKTEERMTKRMTRAGKLFAFLRKHRLELFDEDFQAELAKMYSDVPRGAPKPPALLAMVTLLQAYEMRPPLKPLSLTHGGGWSSLCQTVVRRGSLKALLSNSGSA